MPRVKTGQLRLPWYLIPILLGLCGVLYSRTVPNDTLRGVILLASVGVPLFVLGNLFTRLHSRGGQRLLLLMGTVMLAVGAMFTLSGLSEDFGDWELVPPVVVFLSYWGGMLCLILGFLATIVWVVRTDEVVEEVGQRFRHLIDHMNDGFLLETPDRRVALVNQNFLDMAGMDEEQVTGGDCAEIFARLEADSIDEADTPLDVETTGDYRVTWEATGARRYFWVNVSPIYSRRGQLGGRLVTCRDITTQQELSARLERYTQGLQQLVEDRTHQLRQSEERMRDLLVNMSQGFGTLDAELRVRFANDRMCDMLGVDKRAIIGRAIHEFVAYEYRHDLQSLFDRASQGDVERVDQEVRLLRDDDTTLPVVAAISSVRSPQEDELRFALVFTDVTELKAMQDELEDRASQLEAAYEELKQLDQAKDSFLTNVSHELRTPLSTIRGYMEMFDSGGLGPLDEAKRNALAVMERNVQRLSLLIDDMIDFSRMQIQGIRIDFSLFDPADLLRECASSFEPQLIKRSIALRFKLPDEPCLAWGDREKLAQVLTILLSNAVKFSEQDGVIAVKARTVAEGGLEISVADQGIGIDPAVQDRVFEKFFQADSSMTRRYEGAGIGLSIAKSITDAHGGNIELDSRLGGGSIFTVSLPGAAFNPEETLSTSPLTDKRVYLLAERGETRDGLSRLLRRMGAEVSGFRTGYEGLRAASDDPADLVIVDDVLPDISGIATIMKLKEQPTAGRVPALLLSSEQGDDDFGGFSPGGAGKLQKPFTAASFVAKVIDGALSPADRRAQARFDGGKARRAEEGT
jgi:two-component system, sensor histidine kinase and response regulator